MSAKKKPGRKFGTRVTYTPDQTLRYQDQKTRYEKSLNLFPAKVEEIEGEKVYWFASERAPDGFWRVTVSEESAWVPYSQGGFFIESGFVNFEAESFTRLKFTDIRFPGVVFGEVRTENPIAIPAGKRLILTADIRAEWTAAPTEPHDPAQYFLPGFDVRLQIERADDPLGSAVGWSASYDGEFWTEDEEPQSLRPLNPTYFNTAAPITDASDGVQIPDERLGGNFFGLGDWVATEPVSVAGAELVYLRVFAGSTRPGLSHPDWRFSYDVDLTLTYEDL